MEEYGVPTFNGVGGSNTNRRKRCFETEEENEEIAGFNGCEYDVSLRVLGMVFRTIDEAESFYICYGRELGFDIRTHKIEKIQPSKFVKSVKWVCHCEGYRRKRTDELFRVRESRHVTRHGCKAFLRVSYHSRSGQYRVTSFEANHCHKLATGEEARNLRCNRYLTSGDKATYRHMREIGVAPSKSMKFIEKLMGGIGNLPFKKKDGYNFNSKEKMDLIRNGDVNAAFNMMDGIKLNDPGFAVRHTLHDDGSLANILWCDSMSKAEYEAFGDVLVIDSTYKTNVYRRPLVILSGVNNHGCNCIFGAALLFNETIPSYRWLFEEFAREMNYKLPRAILSDQDNSICQAVKDVFPHARHRLCSWHLCRNATQKVRKQDFVNGFGSLAKRNCSEQEFESRWAKLVRDCGVADNPWVIDIYKKKKMWSEAYFRGVFLAGMRTTQRAESINSLLKLYTTPGLSITEFIRTFYLVVQQMRSNFVEKQMDDEIRKPNAREGSTFFELEEYAASVCTKSIFKKIRENIFAEQSIITVSKVKVGEKSFIFTFREHKKDKNKLCSAAIDMVNENFHCDCMMLESRGIPCPHVLAGLKDVGFETVPTKCIDRRWLVETGKSLRTMFANSLPKPNTNRNQYGLLVKEVISICQSLQEEDKFEFTELLNYLRKFSKNRKEKMDAINRATVNDKAGPSVKSRKHDIRDPVKVKTKGAPARQKQTCGLCKVAGHNRITCPDNPANEGRRNNVYPRNHAQNDDDNSPSEGLDDWDDA